MCERRRNWVERKGVLGCGWTFNSLSVWLPSLMLHVQVPLRRPDGDVELVDAGVGFQLASCGVCGGDLLKPDVVFFGDSVPKDRVER